MYIGSSSNINKRFAEHKRMLKNNKHYNIYMQNAWNKYGHKSFIFKAIEVVEQDMLLTREQYWMDYYKSYEPENGYNIIKTANVPLDEVRRKIGMAGRDPNRNKGTKKVYQFNSDGKLIKEWESAMQASRELNIHFENISQCCCHPDRFKTSNGFIWSFEDTIDLEMHKQKPYPKNARRNRKPIVQLSVKGKYIREFPSLKSASDELGYDMRNIWKVLKNKKKQYCGFVFIYKSQYEDMIKDDKKKTGS